MPRLKLMLGCGGRALEDPSRPSFYVIVQFAKFICVNVFVKIAKYNSNGNVRL